MPAGGQSRPPCLHPADQAEARARVVARVTAAAPHLAADAERLLDRLPPDRWALEWSLPCWLGEALALPRTVWLDLVVSNLLGLGFVRLTDGLLDGDGGALGGGSLGKGSLGGDRTGAEPELPHDRAVLLAATLQHLWLASLRAAGSGAGAPKGAAFWDHFDAYLRQWQAATWASLTPLPSPFGPDAAADLTPLGHRGAPLKVCAAAACLLADQPARLPPIAAAIDDLLTGAVLLDHALDWEEDLARRRPNVFVAYLLRDAAPGHGAPGHGAPGPRDPSRSAVSAALLAQGGGGDYFAGLRAYLQKAVAGAGEAGIAPLAGFAGWLDAQAAALDGELSRRVETTYRAAGALLRVGPGKIGKLRSR